MNTQMYFFFDTILILNCVTRSVKPNLFYPYVSVNKYITKIFVGKRLLEFLKLVVFEINCERVRNGLDVKFDD